MTPLDHFVIYKRGKVYYYYVYRNGRKVHRSTGEHTKAKAQQRILMRLNGGDILQDKVSDLFGDYVQKFWHYDTCPIVRSALARGKTYGKETCRTNLQRTAKYLVPQFGRKRLNEITPGMIRDWILELNDTGLAHGTINAVLSLLRMELAEAVADQMIDKNPADAVKALSKTVKNERGVFTKAEVRKMLSTQCDVDFLPLMIEIAATTGMRVGEIMALQLEDIHDDHIMVRHSYAVLSKLKSTKSSHKRPVPCMPSTIRKIRTMARISGSRWIFSLDGNEPISHSTVAKYMHMIMNECGIDWESRNLGFHSLRHFLNTQLSLSGVAPEKIRAIIGHDSEEMTEHYLHLTLTDYQQVRDIQELIV